MITKEQKDKLLTQRQYPLLKYNIGNLKNIHQMISNVIQLKKKSVPYKIIKQHILSSDLPTEEKQQTILKYQNIIKKLNLQKPYQQRGLNNQKEMQFLSKKQQQYRKALDILDKIESINEKDINYLLGRKEEYLIPYLVKLEQFYTKLDCLSNQPQIHNNINKVEQLSNKKKAILKNLQESIAKVDFQNLVTKSQNVKIIQQKKARDQQEVRNYVRSSLQKFWLYSNQAQLVNKYAEKQVSYLQDQHQRTEKQLQRKNIYPFGKKPQDLNFFMKYQSQEKLLKQGYPGQSEQSRKYRIISKAIDKKFNNFGKLTSSPVSSSSNNHYEDRHRRKEQDYHFHHHRKR